MCGRYVLRTATPEIARILGAEGPLLNTPARYNIAPTQTVPVCRAIETDSGPKRTLAELRWGLVPFWSRDMKGAFRMINARAETAATKPAFRAAFKRRRCIVPADGYYEWRKVGAIKQPHFIHGRPATAGDEPPLLRFAGLWERWTKGEDGPVESFSILTTSASADVEAIHDRMPVVLGAADAERWLSTSADDSGALQELLIPAPVGTLSSYLVSTHVNNVRHEDAHCIDALNEGDG